MDKGIVIFAHNSRSLDYSKLALVAGGLAKKHLGYPVSLITDKSTVDYMEEIGTADKAKEIGLINDIYSTDDVTNQTMKLAQKIATKSSLTLATGKKAFYAQAEMNLSNAYEYTSKVMTDNLMRDDAKEGINAFIEKRDPDWQDN